MIKPDERSVRGDYRAAGPKPGQIDFDRLAAINLQINNRVLIALHGTNDLPPDLTRKCIQSGAIELNVTCN